MPTRAASNARTRLAALREKKPPTKASQIRALWPEIRMALDNGHSLKAVCECLAADGIAVSVQSLGSYIGRIRRASEQAYKRSNAGPIENPSRRTTDFRQTTASNVRGEQPMDPLANVRERQDKRPAFDYRPELADAKDLI
jgi:hypothetical protein